MALGELKCPSLDYVYRMTWAEFRIRLYSYKRQEKDEWLKLRELMWVTYIAPYQDPKRMKKTKENFMPLEGKKKATDEMIERMKIVKERYLKEVNG